MTWCTTMVRTSLAQNWTRDPPGPSLYQLVRFLSQQTPVPVLCLQSGCVHITIVRGFDFKPHQLTQTLRDTGRTQRDLRFRAPGVQRDPTRTHESPQESKDPSETQPGPWNLEASINRTQENPTGPCGARRGPAGPQYLQYPTPTGPARTRNPKSGPSRTPNLNLSRFEIYVPAPDALAG